MVASEPSPVPSSAQDSTFDDFDDYGTPAETLAASGDELDDDFGDFGDFGAGVQVVNGATFDASAFDTEDIFTPRPPADWHALHLDPIPSREDLQDHINNILGPLWTSDDPSHYLDDPIRQVDGLHQTLVTPERYVFENIVHYSYLKSQISPVGNYTTYYCLPHNQTLSR